MLQKLLNGIIASFHNVRTLWFAAAVRNSLFPSFMSNFVSCLMNLRLTIAIGPFVFEH